MVDMSVDSLKNNLTNPARSYLWEVLFANPIGGDTDTFLIRCRSTSIPGRSVGKIHLAYKQTAGVEYPGKLTYDHAWPCSFVEGEDRAMFDALYDWAQAVVNDKTGLGQAVLKVDLYLNLLNTDGTTPMKIKIVGAYLESMESVGIAQESENEIVYPAVWSYDRWEKI